MSLPRYPKYKDSGVEWLGQVPEHWETLKLGHLLKSSPCYGVLVPDFEEEGVPMLRITDMEGGKANRASLNRISHALSAEYTRTIVEKGDVVLSVVGTIGKAFQVDADLAGVNLSRAVARLQLNQDFTAEFACWIFQSLQFKRYVDLVCVGTAQRVLNMADLTAFRIVRPIVFEQTAIANFLDRETAKIDGLIEEQRRLIELLKEKRQAVISHAVTKGLDPNVPLKDSGIEWLGMVPEHWNQAPVWLLFELGRGRVISHEEIMCNPGEYPVYSSQTENDGVMGSLNSYAFEGDYLTWTTDGANAGTVFRRSGRFNCTNVCGTLKARSSDVLLDYSWYALAISTAAFVRHDINPKLMNNVMGKIRIPIPPLREQSAIASFLDAETAKIDNLTTEAERAIELLGERRSALISAAVTGQIDVRSLSAN